MYLVWSCVMIGDFLILSRLILRMDLIDVFCFIVMLCFWSWNGVLIILVLYEVSFEYELIM